MEDINLIWPETGDDESGIFFTSHDVPFTMSHQEKIKQWIFNTTSAEGHDLSRLDVVFCTDGFLLTINKEHLNHDFYTDIITFPLSTDPISAELYISIDRVKENATNLRIPFSDELHRVIIHGVLHLCGYDDHHESDILIIRAKEETYLKVLQL